MARINIEECWWTDPRRSKLARLIGDEDKADGVAVRMWRIAQEFWGRGRLKIPFDVFETLEYHQHLLGCHLASLGEDGGVYVRGSSEHLDWFAAAKASRSRGGKNSALRPRNSKGQLLPNSKINHREAISPSEVKNAVHLDQETPKRVQETSILNSISGETQNDAPLIIKKLPDHRANSPSEVQVKSKRRPTEAKRAQVSYSYSGSKELRKEEELKAKPLRGPASCLARFVSTYVKAFETRYKVRPDLSGKVIGEIKTYLRDTDLSIDEACELIQVYLRADYFWFAAKAHDITTFAKNQNRLKVTLTNGGEGPPTGASDDPYALMKKTPAEVAP